MTRTGTNIYLIGPMGSGKTTVGQRVAKQLGLKFFDCDRELESQTGASVNLIFDIEGEAGFRKRESSTLIALTDRKNVLVATGGGAILSEENRELLKRTGLVVYLQTTVNQQLHRLRRDRTRPLLQQGDPRQKLSRLAAARNPIYEELADLVFLSQNRGPKIAAQHLTDAILACWKPSTTRDRKIDGDRPSHGASQTLKK